MVFVVRSYKMTLHIVDKTGMVAITEQQAHHLLQGTAKTIEQHVTTAETINYISTFGIHK